jgi:membrane-bound lytic murein transglycosylase D
VSDRYFNAGQQELELGRVDVARLEFNKAIAVLAESPYGGRTEPRIRERLDQLVARVREYQLNTPDGDVFAEQQYEPASIDELLALTATLTRPPRPSEALKNAVESDLQTAVHDVPIPLNQKVIEYIALFQGRLHDFIQEGLSRGAKYLPMIQNVLRAEGLPLDLAYVPLIESAFKPNALSRAQAKGVWQFVPGTGLENGLRQDWYIDERSDPEKATVAAAKYLSMLVQMFEGDWHLALASYNGGPGRVQRAMKRGRQTDFWKLAAAKVRYLPRETREYVPMILAAIVVGKNPQQYGFELDTARGPLDYDTVTVSGPVDLRRIAEFAGTTVDEIRALNPELRRWTTPARDSSYELKVPVGVGEVVAAHLEVADPADLATLHYYTVKRGETITSIARKLKVTRTDLAEANYLKATARLSDGQQLMVPREAVVLMAARTDEPVSDSGTATIDTVVPAVASASTGTELVKTFYRVKSGDTLGTVARMFNTTVAALQRWNDITGSIIRIGDRLTIYTARSN